MSKCRRCGKNMLLSDAVYCPNCQILVDQEEAERRRLEEKERQKKAAEALRRQREEAERRRIAELEAIYSHFSNYTDVDCSVLVKADYRCSYDEVRFQAEINQPQEYLDSAYKKSDGSYNTNKDGSKEIYSYLKLCLSLDMKMVCDGTKCWLYPRLLFRYSFGPSYGGHTIEKLYIRIGENRYSCIPSSLKKTTYRDDEYNSAVILLGSEDIKILEEITEGKYPVVISGESGQGKVELSPWDIAQIRDFVDVCTRAGVFMQEKFKTHENAFETVTRFNKASLSPEE